MCGRGLAGLERGRLWVVQAARALPDVTDIGFFGVQELPQISDGLVAVHLLFG